MVTYNQGESKEKDCELFCEIGAVVLDPKTHKDLGIAVSSLPGDIWVFENGSFAQGRIMKNKKFHIRYVYGEGKKIKAKLIKALIKVAKFESVELIYTNDRKTEEVWSELDFKTTQLDTQKTFVKWQLIL